MDIPEFLQKSLKHLAVVHAQALIPGQSGQAAAQTTLAELARLVSLASSLAFSDSASDRGKAYEIVTRAVLVSKNDPMLCHSAAVVLTRLGNFPGLELLRRRYMKDAATLGLPPVFALEEAVRRSENTIAGIARTFTDFQTRLFHTLQKFPAASISAPTSAGKSFVFAVDIAQKFRSAKSPLCIAYIVPTRALIRQVAGDVRRHLREARIENIPVRCVPLAIPVDREARGAVYVLTQERLLTLLGQSPLEGTKEIDVLLIDEAHGIMDGSRGIQLHAAIDLTRRRFPKCCVYFASPLVSNPEHLLDLFNLREGAETFTETVSPVGQNVFLVHPTKQTRTARFDILLGDEAVPVAERLLDFDLKGGTSPARRAGFALAITAHQKLGQRSCILFANGPSDAESLAKALVAEPSRSKELPVVIQEFIEFLGEHVHPEYQLIEMLRHRVAYHHSKMPGPVRAGVEDLFTDGHLRFICCTSTLLQGVNLPASDIVIENPKKGSDNPMDRSSFLNLIGRAGRLTKEFYGNIWCINPSGWDEPVFKGDSLTKLQSALEEAISDGGELIRSVANGTIDEMDAYDTGSVAMGKVIDDFILTEAPSNPPYTANVPSEDWQITLEQLKIYRGTLPADVLRHNFTLPAGKLGALFEHLVTAPDILSLIPLEPWKTGAYKILQSVMQLVRETLNPPSRKYRRFHAWLAFWWMRGESLRWLIDARFKNCKDAAAKNGEPLEMTINDVIPTIVDGIEKTLRFEYARDIKAYLELLPLALAERDPDAEHPPIPPLPLYLECGTTNQKVIKLMSLGLTRMTAMFAAKLITMIRTDATPEQWFSALAKLPLKNVKLPKVCIQEIEHLTRGR